jgi:hypothetical protein
LILGCSGLRRLFGRTAPRRLRRAGVERAPNQIKLRTDFAWRVRQNALARHISTNNHPLAAAVLGATRVEGTAQVGRKGLRARPQKGARGGGQASVPDRLAWPPGARRWRRDWHAGEAQHVPPRDGGWCQTTFPPQSCISLKKMLPPSPATISPIAVGEIGTLEKLNTRRPVFVWAPKHSFCDPRKF